jgi:hypothetical protein
LIDDWKTFTCSAIVNGIVGLATVAGTGTVVYVVGSRGRGQP